VGHPSPVPRYYPRKKRKISKAQQTKKRQNSPHEENFDAKDRKLFSRSVSAKLFLWAHGNEFFGDLGCGCAICMFVGVTKYDERFQEIWSYRRRAL